MKRVGGKGGSFVSYAEPVAGASSPLRLVDLIIFALIIGFGALQFFCTVRPGDFMADDVFFADAARSIIKHGFYGINGYAETNQPPGLAGILALLCIAGGCAQSVLLPALTVFGTVGFLISYELLRRQAPRVIAATICLLLISSPIHFRLGTQSLSAAYPYFVASTGALLVAWTLDRATRFAVRIALAGLLALLVVASLLFASAGIALLGALVATIGVMLVRDRGHAYARLKVYLTALLLGAAVQGFWMHQGSGGGSAGISASEWPVPGFPKSYLSQLKVKSGNYPELGIATSSDIAVRIIKNASMQGNLVSQMLLRKPLVVTTASILILVPILLISVGWCSCFLGTGGSLQEWYFAGYEFIYLLWPWNPAQGWVFLPVMPLACLYMWRGGLVIVCLAKTNPRILGAVWFPIAIALAAFAWLWVHGSGIANHLDNSGRQDELSFAGWSLSAVVAAWMALAGPGWYSQVSGLLRRCSRSIGPLRINPLWISRALGMSVVAGLLIVGLGMQLKIGRANLDPYSPINRLSPDAAAGIWIRSHTDQNAVVMARHVPIMYHYSERKVIWFPPSSDPQLLMEGIRRYKVDYAIVVRRRESYYLPPDEACFAPLLEAYPDAFHLVYQDPQFRIFQVGPKAVVPSKVTLLSPSSAAGESK
jgi:hypothetical protein